REVRDIGLPGTLLGIVPRVTLGEQRTHMRKGDLLLLYTDGLADEPNSPAPFTHDDLRELLIRMAGLPAGQGAVESEQRRGQRRRHSRWADDVAYLVARCVE